MATLAFRAMTTLVFRAMTILWVQVLSQILFLHHLPLLTPPVLQPLGADVTKTIQGAPNKLGQRNPSNNQSPPVLKRSTKTKPVNQGAPKKCRPPIDHSAPSRTPTSSPPQQGNALEISSQDDIPASSLPRQYQAMQGPTRKAREAPTAAFEPGSHRSTGLVPPGVLEAFQPHIPLLINRSARGWPKLYETCDSFWLPRKSNFFVHDEGASTASENAVTTTGGEASTRTTRSRCNPSFFFWDPMPLVIGGIRCPSPGCSKRLSRAYFLKEPRRVVFASESAPNSETICDDVFWVFGVKYKCYYCVSGDKVSYDSWDPRLLACLPAPLRAEFPAVERDGQLIALDHVVSNTN